MPNHFRVLLAMSVAAVLVITSYRLAPGADENTLIPDQTSDVFSGNTVLVVFDLGSDGVDRTVLNDAALKDIGDKQFLSGVVTNKYPDFRVVMPGKKAFIAMDRIVYMQILDKPSQTNE